MAPRIKPMNRRDWLAIGLGAALAARAQAQSEAQLPELPRPVDWPPIRLLDGTTIEPSTWHGQPSIVVLWATWCPFCKRHNAHVDKLYRMLRGQPPRILGVAEDKNPQAVRDYMRANGFSFPAALDTMGLRASLTRRRGIPITCVIDREGRLAQVIPGEMFEEDVLEFAKLAAPHKG